MALMQKMLQLDMADVHLLRQQLNTARTRGVDADGSFRVHTGGPPWNKSSERVPIEAQVVDQDDIPTKVLMHVLDELIREIEIYRVDGKAASFEFELHGLEVREAGPAGNSEDTIRS
jgi:hypothetical protein